MDYNHYSSNPIHFPEHLAVMYMLSANGRKVLFKVLCLTLILQIVQNETKNKVLDFRPKQSEYFSAIKSVKLYVKCTHLF